MGCGPSAQTTAAGGVNKAANVEPEKYRSQKQQQKAAEAKPVADEHGEEVPTEALPEETRTEGSNRATKEAFHGEQNKSVVALEERRRREEEMEKKREEVIATKDGQADDELIDALFMFGDFVVEKNPKKPKKQTAERAGENGETFGTELQLVESDLEEQIVKDYLEKKYFTYSDFNINLEEMILNPMGMDEGPPTNDVEAYRFAFGDFNLGVTEEQLRAANANSGKPSHMRILNYEQHNLLGHSTRVKCICISPNERFYVSSSAKDATIVMYDLKTGKEFLYFDGHEDTIIGAHFSNDGKHLATASRDNTLILWDTVLGKQIFVFEHERIVICCCFSRDGKYIVSGCQDKVCRVWSTKKGKELLAFKGHEGIITAVSYAPDGENIVSASSDRTIKIWSSTTGICVCTLQEHTGIVMSCMYSFDGNYIVSNDEKVVNIWDVKKQKVSLSLPVDQVPPHGNVANVEGTKKRTWTICSCCPGAFSYYIMAACSDRNVYIIHPQTGEVVLSFFCKAAVYCLSSGLRNTLSLGDAFGNVYAVTLR